jgi:glycosyltransferase involved in cell wall biosynthesis
MFGNKVTVGLPVYNDEKTVKSAIESILNQTYTNLELIISDNCSTDSTGIICLELAKNDSRIIYFRQNSNIGLIPNWNFVLEKAESEYFMWLGGDDKFEENYIFECLKVFSENEDCTTVFCHFYVYDTNSNILVSRITPSSTSMDFSFARVRLRLKEVIPNILFGLHKRSFLSKISKFESFDWFDVFACIELSYYGKIYVIPKYLYYCGTDGRRKPYSLTGELFNMSIFNKKFLNFVYSKFSFKRSVYLILYSRYISFFSQKRLNSVIKSWEY